MVFESLSEAPAVDLPHALRWYNHISSYGTEKASFPGIKKGLESYGGGTASNGMNGTKKDDDDDLDLFGSDSEEVLNLILCYSHFSLSKLSIIHIYLPSIEIKNFLFDERTRPMRGYFLCLFQSKAKCEVDVSWL